MGWLGKFYKITFVAFLIFVFSVICPRFSIISAQTVGGKSAEELQNEIKEYENKLNEISKKKNTLASQIEYMNTQIKLTALRINETEESIDELKKQISGLSIKIETLEGSLSSVSRILLDRIVATYKAREVSPIYIFFSSSGFNDFLNKAKYLQIAQANDKKLLYAIESTKTSYKKQKNLREEKKEELEGLQEKLKGQKAVLGQQKTAKENLLEVTKNDEKKYQELLAAARAELASIQQAVKLLQKSGKPVEIGRGDIIGVQGSTGFSTGDHLHFGVYNYSSIDELIGDWYHNNYEDPSSILSARDILWNTGCGDNGIKKTGSGSWDWPMRNIKYISQGYGNTCYSQTFYEGRPHPAYDIVGPKNTSIYAVEKGKAYFCRNCLGDGGNGVFVFHDNGKMTMYWHVQ